MEELVSVVQAEHSENALTPWMQERAKLFGKWMWVYFWMMFVPIVPAIIAVVEEMSMTDTIIGTVLGWCCSAVTIYALFRMGEKQDRLKTCAGLNAVALAAQIILQFVNSETLTNLWSIPGAIIGLIVVYQFMHGCGDTLVGVDNELSNKWYRLWKWYIWLTVGGVIGVPVTLFLAYMVENTFAAVMAVILMLAWVVMLLVQVVREIVYIYRTAKIFRGIAANL